MSSDESWISADQVRRDKADTSFLQDGFGPKTRRVPFRAPRVITVVVNEGGSLTLFEGERFCDRLSWDEFLGTIAVLTHPELASKAQRIPPWRLCHVDTFLNNLVHGRERDAQRESDPAAWVCAHCRQLNSSWAIQCGRCDTARGLPVSESAQSPSPAP